MGKAKEPAIVALRPINLPDGSVAQIGDLVPGAIDWPNLQAWIDNGDVRAAYPGEPVAEAKSAEEADEDHGASPVQTPERSKAAAKALKDGTGAAGTAEEGTSGEIVPNDASPIQTPERSRASKAAAKRGEASEQAEQETSGDIVSNEASPIQTPERSAKSKARAKSQAKGTARASGKTTAKSAAKKSAAKKTASRKTTARKR